MPLFMRNTEQPSYSKNYFIFMAAKRGMKSIFKSVFKMTVEKKSVQQYKIISTVSAPSLL